MVRTMSKFTGFMVVAITLAFLLPALAGSSNRIEGKVKSIDTTKMELVLTGSKDFKTYNFKLDTKTKVQLSNNQIGRLQNVMVGDEVTVTWRQQGLQRIATEVQCKSKK
jgi:hypothetical protein